MSMRRRPEGALCHLLRLGRGPVWGQVAGAPANFPSMTALVQGDPSLRDFCGIRGRSSSMNSNFNFARRAPDSITEELVAVLSGPKSYEFKALFLVIQAALRARNAISGGEEMLRLRAYDKLQNLVQHGQVKKTGKQYKGVRKGLLLLAENLKALRENGPAH